VIVKALRWFVVPVAVLALAACGSSSKPAATTSAPTTTAAPTPTTQDPAAAKASITANWTTFFDGTNPDVNGKLALLENSAKIGTAYKQALAKAGTAASQGSSKVSGVELLSLADCNTNLGENVPCAKVTYDLLVNGKPALSGQTGYAVYVDGAWKVSEVTDCGLSHLGGVDCPA
jgi:hypothetical protein